MAASRLPVVVVALGSQLVSRIREKPDRAMQGEIATAGVGHHRHDAKAQGYKDRESLHVDVMLKIVLWSVCWVVVTGSWRSYWEIEVASGSNINTRQLEIGLNTGGSNKGGGSVSRDEYYSYNKPQKTKYIDNHYISFCPYDAQSSGCATMDHAPTADCPHSWAFLCPMLSIFAVSLIHPNDPKRSRVDCLACRNATPKSSHEPGVRLPTL